MGIAMTLKSIVADLAEQAKANEARAYDLIGGQPGPGFDLLIRPIEPMCGKWYVDGLTLAGKGFVKRFWEYQPMSNQKIAEMRKQARNWGLTYRTEYQILSLTEKT